MKRAKSIAILLVALITMLAVPASVEAKKKKAEIRFSETSHNFGTIAEKGGKVSHEFTFYNDGDAPLVIMDATAECGCTKPEFPANPIEPGKSGKLKVTFNPLGRPGGFTKTVTVRSNGQPKKTRIKISGVVNPNR